MHLLSSLESSINRILILWEERKNNRLSIRFKKHGYTLHFRKMKEKEAGNLAPLQFLESVSLSLPY